MYYLQSLGIIVKKYLFNKLLNMIYAVQLQIVHNVYYLKRKN